MKTKLIPAAHLKVGDAFVKHGYCWIAQRIHFDPLGNNGTTPRFLIDARSIDAPKGFNDCVLGVACTDPISVPDFVEN